MVTESMHEPNNMGPLSPTLSYPLSLLNAWFMLSPWYGTAHWHVVCLSSFYVIETIIYHPWDLNCFLDIGLLSLPSVSSWHLDPKTFRANLLTWGPASIVLDQGMERDLKQRVFDNKHMSVGSLCPNIYCIIEFAAVVQKEWKCLLKQHS